MSAPVSNCCYVPLPNYDESDLCPECLEHCDAMPTLSDRIDILEKAQLDIKSKLNDLENFVTARAARSRRLL